MDLTLECIRRHCLDESSPLAETLSRYRTFFALFVDFRGYVRFFLLDDLISERDYRVEFFLPFDDFRNAAVPQDIEAYRSYRRQSMDFIRARNARIKTWCSQDVRSRTQGGRA